MDNRKNIDDFFKKKLEGESFDFDEKYWAGAEALLDEDKRKKRFAFWWWSMNGLLGLGLLITVLGLGTFWYVNHKSNDTIAKIENTSEATSQNSIETTGITAKVENTTTDTNGNIQSVKANNINRTQNSTLQNDQNQSILNTNSNIEASKKGTQGNANARRPIPSLIGKNGIIGSVLAGENAATIRGTAGDSNQSQNTLPIVVESDEFTKTTEEEVNTLPQRMVALMFGRTNDLPALKLLKSTKPVLKKRWQFGVEAGAAMPMDSTGFGLPRYHAGLFAQYRLNEQFYLKSGANFIQQKVNFTSWPVTQIGYGFGNEDIIYQYKDKTAQYIEVPFVLGYTQGKHCLEAGFGLRRLINVQSALYESNHVLPSDRTQAEAIDFEENVLFPFYEEGNSEPFTNPPVFMKESLVQTGTRKGEAYNAMLFNVQLGYRFRVNSRFDIGLNGTYRFWDVFGGELMESTRIAKTSIGLTTRFKF